MKIKIALIALSLLSLPFATLAQTSTVSTNMTILPGTADNLPAGVQNLGPVATNTPEQVIIGLQQTAQQKVDEQAFLNGLTDRSSPDFHQFLTSQEWNVRFGASNQEVAAVTQWLSNAGFTNINLLQAGGDLLQFNGTAGLFENAFDISINNYVVNGKTCQASPDNQSVPSNIASLVGGFSVSDCFSPIAEAIGSKATNATTSPVVTISTTVATSVSTNTGENSSTTTSHLPLIIGSAIILAIIIVIAAIFIFR